MPKKVILLTLQMFSSTGGIQKMTRTLAYSLNRIADEKKWKFEVFSAYDANHHLMPQYLPATSFKGFNIRRVAFVIDTLKAARTTDVLILSHINLAIIGLLAKIINPKCKTWLIAHGIEVWRPLSIIQKRFIKHCDKVVCVSSFTKQKVVEYHQTDTTKCFVLNNTVDPFMKLPASFEKPARLMEKYNLRVTDPVVYTLTRLASTEQYKGYEQVIKAIGSLKAKYPTVKYILSGKYDSKEEQRINELINDAGVAGSVILTGFVDERELPDHFLLADIFVLPSQKEGFGIVFIEAMACGLPVICGNADGSVDAVRNGELGHVINPDDQQALERAINDSLNAAPPTAVERKKLQQHCLLYFNEPGYRSHLQQILSA